MAGNSSSSILSTGAVIEGPYSGTGPLVCSIFFCIVCPIIVGLRLTARHFSKGHWGWDDYLLVPSLLMTLVILSTFIYQIINCGGGYHEEAVAKADPAKLVLFAKLDVLSPAALAIGLGLPRCCLLAAYLRIFTNKTLRLLTWIVLGMTVLCSIIVFIICVTVCIPLDSLWDSSIHGTCINELAFWGYATLPVLIFDCFTMALPVSTMLQLQRPLHERMGLLGAFLGFGIGTLAEIARIVVFNTVNGKQDITWTFVPLVTVSACEISAYLIACCIPGLRPLWLHLMGKGSFSKKSSGSGDEGKSQNIREIVLPPRCKQGFHSQPEVRGDWKSSNDLPIFKMPQQTVRPSAIRITRSFIVS